ncbi:MAG: RagB/SusD family nutrient uptake outer membrane protein [Bacteroidales bacterium]|nr:RagB/SusD family nutrient uptake outer membrane protein [Bacteroidales bacterium]
MKKLIYITLLLVTGLVAASCVKDLDAYPFNEDDFTSENAYGSDYANYVSGLAKIYRCFNNTSDLQVEDGGASELIRAFWCVQECSTDACKNDWEKDSWTQDINKNTWSTADNAASYALYCRTLHGITYANEFLRQTTDERLADRGCSSDVIAKVHSLREEARLLRAFMYWMSMDTFGDVPFVTEESEFGSASPTVKTRSEVFDFVESELKALTASSDMPAAGSNYPRVDKGTAWGLLSRLYLNAQVYKNTVDANGNVTQKGPAMWSECIAACEEVFKLNYGLCENYPDLFRGDNGENPEARKEMLFAIDYDEISMNSWGGTIFLAESCFQAGDDKDENGNPMYSLGVADGWAGIRVPSEYVFKYFGVTVPEEGYDAEGKYTGVYNYTDERAGMFFIKGHREEMTDLAEFTQGWSFYKYNNIPHNMTREEFASSAKSYGSASAKCGIDYPVMRLAEIYLNYAEACVMDGQAAKGLPYLNALRDRAEIDPLPSYTLEDVQNERAVELCWEAFRRTDLIRWDQFHSGDFLWRWKGGSYQGQGFSQHLLVFDFPQSELTANSNLSHKPGYAN